MGTIKRNVCDDKKNPCPNKKPRNKKRVDPERGLVGDRLFFLHRFPRLKEIQAYIRKLEKDYPLNVRVEIIGESHYGNTIDLVVISEHVLTQKWGILIDAGIHAREWITHTSALYIINHLLEDRNLLQYFDFYVIPCLNPDGYEYSHTKCRLWRKNLFPHGPAQGVDLNRNFPIAFGNPGSSSDPKSYMYRGTHALSEPEAQCLAEVMNKYEAYIKLYVSLHTFGNCIMYPWGHTPEPISDEEILKECGNAAKCAMFNCHRRRYSVGSVASRMYITSGCATDYARGIHNIKFSYTIELQRGGPSGFTISPTKIRQLGREVMVGVEAMAKFVYKYFYDKYLRDNEEDEHSFDCCRDDKRKRSKYHFQ